MKRHEKSLSITVTGKKTEVDESLNLSIPTDKTVVWEAEFIAKEGCSKILIYFQDSGTLEIAQGAVLKAKVH